MQIEECCSQLQFSFKQSKKFFPGKRAKAIRRKMTTGD